MRIVSVARLEAPKDPFTLLRALVNLNVQVDLIGDGPLEPRCRKLAQTLGIVERVHFLGYQPEVAPILARAHIFALSTNSEAFPRSVLEAMRAGLPVVASKVGGIPEAVDNGLNGLLYPAGDASALAAALTRLVEQPAERERLGANARAAYESRFRLEQMIEHTLRLYETVAKNG